ncbi:AMP-binding protein [Polaromonas sp. YR568]|uniref:AMP-binding protein n=1 Tax=Polaromonas sp. YR568 TaxID=1855301 RepID=UPI00398BE2DF
MADWWSLSDLACRPPDARRLVALTGDGKHVSHADLLERTACWQGVFSARPQSHFALYFNDPFEFAAALLAAWHAGKTPVLPGDDRPDTVRAMLEAGYLLAGDLPGALQAGAVPEAAGRQPLNLSEARLRLYTSGSQGQPEAIDKRLDQLVSEVEALQTAFGPLLAGRDAQVGAPTVWATVSHQHIYGLLFLVLWPLAAGRPFGARRLLYPEDLAACLGAQPSIMVSTPAHLKRLGEPPNWEQARHQLRAIFSSGGPLPFEVSQSAATILGRTPIEVFGSSETGGIAWRQSAAADQPWQPFSDVHWRLDGECLSVQSPRLPDAAWWTTSDRAAPAGDGSFRLLGRVDRIAKIEEKRVSLSAVEQQLLATPWVREAKALVVDTAVGARVGVVAVLTPAGREQENLGRRGLVDLLREALSSRVEAVALPRRWRFVEALPVNAQGKTPEALLAALFAPQAPAARPEMPAVQWLVRGETDALATLDIHAGLTVFDGHFEAAPILPGVAQLDWALSLGRECFALPQRFVRLEALKFVRPVQPGTALHLALQFKPSLADATLCSLSFRLYSHEGRDASSASAPNEHASGRAIWSYEPGAAHA